MSRFSVEGSDAIIEADDQAQAEAFLGLKLIPLDAAKKPKAKQDEAASI
jgi:hypothetical protein